MSRPEGKTGASRRLTVTGPPGVELVIFDGLLQQVERGSERLTARLAPGLYIVRWVSPDAVHDRFVNLAADASPRTLAYPAGMSRSSGVGLASAGPKSRPTRDAVIVVLEQGRHARTKGSMAGVRLFNVASVAMRSSGPAVDEVRKESGEDKTTGVGWVVRVYPVDPGPYRLRFETVGGGFVDQVVPAIKGRRTVVVLRQVTGQSLVNQDGGHAVISRLGADPARTVILSTPQIQARPPQTLDIVLAESLLDGTLPGSTITTSKTIERCAERRADPFLKIYAAAQILAALDRNVSPVIDVALRQPRTRGEGITPAVWRKTARRLLASFGEDGSGVPDVTILRRRLKQSAGPPATLPMLSACLAWMKPDEIALGLPGEDASNCPAPGSAGPWMIRTAESAKSGEVTSKTSPAQSDNRLPMAYGGLTIGVLLIAWLGSGLFAENRLSVLTAIVGLVGGAVAGLAAVASLISTLWATKQAKVEYLDLQERQAERWSRLPAWLRRRDDFRSSVRDWAARSAPPFTRRPILHPDDPNKDRFGGLAARDGFTLTAAFRETDDPKWVEIVLTVKGDPAAERRRNQRAHFFLHDTFDKREISVPLEEARASLVIRAFGGFTVGVWLPGRRVELELDLAGLPNAPQIIKDW